MWQYKTIRIDPALSTDGHDAILKKFARRGWRLVAVSNDMHYFERPLEKADA